LSSKINKKNKFVKKGVDKDASSCYNTVYKEEELQPFSPFGRYAMFQRVNIKQ